MVVEAIERFARRGFLVQLALCKRIEAIAVLTNGKSAIVQAFKS